MGLIIGPTPWWQANIVSVCPEGTYLPDGSRIICKSGGTAWIIAPACTQIPSQWAGGQYNSTLVGDKCCVSEWGGLKNTLINLGFNPTDWFVPCRELLQNTGYVCRTKWDSFTTANYWSSTEGTSTASFRVCFSNNGVAGLGNKPEGQFVRAMRCVTY